MVRWHKARSDKYPDLTEAQYNRLVKLSLTDDRVRIVKPHLTGAETDAGCWIELDTENGGYVTVCPAENIGMLRLDEIAGTKL